MTVADVDHAVTGGVDTHLDVHVAAALDPIGGLFGVESFAATAAGYQALLTWLASFGPIARVGVEGTGAYGAGLARSIRQAGIPVIEVDRANRQARRARGKSDPAIRQTPSRRRVPPSGAGPPAWPSPGTAPSRPSGP